VAGHFGVPVMLVTGDEAVCREARATLGDAVPTVAVKKGISREAAVLLAPDDTRPLLREGARRAVAALPTLRPFKPSFPLTLRTRRLDAQKATLENPRFMERECVVRQGLDVISGSPQ